MNVDVNYPNSRRLHVEFTFPSYTVHHTVYSVQCTRISSVLFKGALQCVHWTCGEATLVCHFVWFGSILFLFLPFYGPFLTSENCFSIKYLHCSLSLSLFRTHWKFNWTSRPTTHQIYQRIDTVNFCCFHCIIFIPNLSEWKERKNFLILCKQVESRIPRS